MKLLITNCSQMLSPYNLCSTSAMGDAEFQPGGKPPLSSVAVAAEGDIFTPSGPKPHSTPQALDKAGIAKVCPWLVMPRTCPAACMLFHVTTCGTQPHSAVSRACGIANWAPHAEAVCVDPASAQLPGPPDCNAAQPAAANKQALPWLMVEMLRLCCVLSVHCGGSVGRLLISDQAPERAGSARVNDMLRLGSPSCMLCASCFASKLAFSMTFCTMWQGWRHADTAARLCKPWCS